MVPHAQLYVSLGDGNLGSLQPKQSFCFCLKHNLVLLQIKIRPDMYIWMGSHLDWFSNRLNLALVKYVLYVFDEIFLGSEVRGDFNIQGTRFLFLGCCFLSKIKPL